MTKRREFTRNQREQIVERSKNEHGQICCEGCGLVLGLKPFEVDHIIPEGLRPDADKKQPLKIIEGQLLGKECCHRGENGKTNRDVKRIAKAKRSAAKHYGINTRKGRSLPRKNPKGQHTATRPLSKTVTRIAR